MKSRTIRTRFNPQTTIEYQLAEQTQVSLDVFDINGRLISSLVNRVQQGNYSIAFDGQNLASGIYFYRLRTNEQTLHKCMLLLK